jgi:hypothetical protein
MLKAKATIGGTATYLIGLSFGNLDKFRAEPGDTYIRIPATESGLPVDILLFSGKTEAHLMDLVKDGIGVDTKLIVSDRLKQ